MAGFDKIGKDTGPGRIANFMDARTNIVCSYVLFNYNIDGNVLKPEHRTFLDERVVPLLRDNEFHTELLGTASKSGDADYNLQLSIGRVTRVKEYLRSKGIVEAKLPGPDVKAAGESMSTSMLDEDQLDRAVRISIALGIKPLPLWPEIVIPITIGKDGPPLIVLPPSAPPNDPEERWTIMQIHGSNAGAGVGASVPFIGGSVTAGLVEYHFLLVNKKTSQMAQCRYFGPGVSAGVSVADWQRIEGAAKISVGPTGGISWTMSSKKWDDFKTKQGVGFADFEGRAHWIEPGGVGMGTSVSIPAKLILPDLGVTVDVSTGNTIGFPGSTASSGHFFCKKPVQLNLPK